MNELRWYLLAIGVVILAVIYWNGRRQKKDAAHRVFDDEPGGEHDVLLGQESAQPASLDEQLDRLAHQSTAALTGEHEATAAPEPTPPALAPAEPPQEIEAEAAPSLPESDAAEAQAGQATEPPLPEFIVFYIVPPEGQTFSGKAVLKAFHAHKLRFGEREIFHRYASGDRSAQPLFSVANMYKPGTLVPGELVNARIRGLSVFMQLPVAGPLGVYLDMLHTTQHLASALGGELRDDRLQPLGQRTIDRLRRQLAEYQP